MVGFSFFLKYVKKKEFLSYSKKKKKLDFIFNLANMNLCVKRERKKKNKVYMCKFYEKKILLFLYVITNKHTVMGALSLP
jgi:hypothetical protein